MNICFYGNYTGRGAEKATIDIANALSDYFSVFVLNSHNRRLIFDVSDKVAYSTLDSKNLIRTIFEISKYIKLNRIDVLVMVEALTGISGLPAAIITGCKTIVWDHSNYYQDKGSRYAKTTRQIELLLCNAVVLLTKRDVALYYKHFKKIRSKLVQIYNYVDTGCGRCFSIDNRKIVSVGHIDSNKNFIIIPRLARYVFEEQTEWKWEIYGAGSEHDIKKLKEEITFQGMNESVLLAGFVRDISNIYKDAGIVVMTSKLEGFPLTLIEAKAHGIPLVSFDIDTGPDEIIDNGINGYLIDKFNVEEMAEKIRRLVKDDNLRNQMSIETNRGLDELNMEFIRAKWITLLNSL